MKRIAIIPLVLVLVLTAEAQQLAFPGAEGFGRYAVGGRGGTIYEVTNLDDRGTGSLREAVEASGPRIVVFRVSGTIELQSRLRVQNPYITIAGQTAPGDGICLKNHGFQISTDHVIVRYMRFRLGDNDGAEDDSVTIYKGQNIILDHCSASWSVDETLSTDCSGDPCTTGHYAGNLTVQWCMITESLNCSIHEKGCHGYASLLRGGYNNGYSFHHNLYAHHRGRSPRPGNYNSYTDDPCGLILDFRNNVVYNWGGSYAGYNEDTTTVTRMNFVGNYYIEGYNSSGDDAFRENCKYSRAYFNDNWMNGICPPDPWSLVQFKGTWTTEELTAYKLSSSLPVEPVTTDDAVTAYERVLADVGASFPQRDAVDVNIINDVIMGTGEIIDCVECDDFYFPTGYAQAATLNTITLENDASDYDGRYEGQEIEILDGTGEGQIRTISDYDGDTRVATVLVNWGTTPDVTSVYGVIVDCTKNSGGSWPVLESTTPPTDTDHDGMPDDWELARGLDPDDADDGAEDRDGDGYTNVEEYLNWLCSAAAKADLDDDFDIDLKDFAVFAEHWPEISCDEQNNWCGGADLTCDGEVGLDDLREFVANWLAGK